MVLPNFGTFFGDSAQVLSEQAKAHSTSLQGLLDLSCDGQVCALAADCLFHKRDFAGALEWYHKAKRFGCSNHGLISKLAHCLMQENHIREAELYFRDLIERDSSDLSATLGLGECYQKRGAHERALMVYQGGRAWDRAHPRILGEAGLCAAHSRQFDYARLYLGEAIKRGGISAKILAYLAYTLESQKHWDQAQETYQQMIQRFPQHSAGYLGVAWLYGMGLSDGINSATGLEMAREAVQLRADATSWEILSACEARAGNFDRAHDIQQQLTSRAQDKLTRLRRQDAMRALRNRQPLNEAHVGRALVA